ncbi:UDP-N-acetylmuramoyl-tripeptide--D-alanyl-D-alanine ligase [Pleionea sp. CnH1-48]|uniref:UDP-N-acetylmuramoyl-tripeptide--D-alanyl-D- alanine ligase n=1 Tax=Pleionea sp. CnH1-48 TaxID=2954494 RepID=UPI002096D7E9|nr:UDP-N-acetylmuramoyl-tripeptide--D-alanyl-D-alanine ligase [Pleionea sp. CnH1-48]MCO7223996.1 UDP-N-acetylmuramoyl-tripeptide--D-alanyl-D-alanine ligase [Pleionea sp. CnH1-48]
MISLSLQDITAATKGRLVGVAETSVNRVITDTRASCDGGLFVALKGANFDAHEFLQDAIDGGASALVVEHEVAFGVPQVVVADCRKALGDIARLVREKSSAQFVGLTGSVGKTTVKEMIAAILSECGDTLATKGNLNNDIGVPLTLFELEAGHEFGVIEMGANHAGEIAYTTDIARPHVALINNVAPAHLEGFGDLQGVADAKGEIFNSLDPKTGVAIINRDDAFADFWLNKIECPSLTFGRSEGAQVTASDISLDATAFASFTLHVNEQQLPVRLSVPGEHSVNNALAATACCVALDIPLTTIVSAIEKFNGVGGRLQVYQPTAGVRIVDDTYNANYSSLIAAIDVISQFDGIKILAIGDMAELGEEAREYHAKAGIKAKQAGIDYLLSVGVLSQFATDAFGDNAVHFSSRQLLTQWVIEKLQQSQGTVLLKGSRSAHMEEVVKQLLSWADTQSGGTQ